MNQILRLLYLYILQPNRVLSLCKTKTPVKTALFFLLLSSIGDLPGFFTTGSELVFTLAVLFLLNTLFVTWLALGWDFLAQWFGSQGQSLRLWAWISLSFIPTSIFIGLSPLYELSNTLLSSLLTILAIATTLYVIYLQIRTIKTLYNLPTNRALLVYFGPVLLLIAVLALLLILMAVI